ncbi:MAG: DNA-binding domain-containing protein [Gammaproteobacteria bacterium]
MNTAPSLHKLQTGFARWMLGEQELPLANAIAGNGLDAVARLQIYRNIIFNNLTAALRTAYPAVLKLVGEEFFEGAAARYIRDYSSTSGNLQDFGAQLADCLAAMPEIAGLPYLVDVARLEWARQLAYLAADAEALEPAVLASVPDDRQNGLRLTLHPSVQLLESAYPILDIWGFCQRDDGEHLALSDAGQRVLIWRTNAQIAMQPLTVAQHKFLALSMAGHTLAAAHEQARQLELGFDISVYLHWLFAAGFITGYSLT